jgi:hypothetical protein
VSEHFDPDTGVTIRMPPKQIPVSEYMMQNVPTLIVHYRMWAERMDKIIRDIEHATRRTDTPVLRLTASRFLDAVLREDREGITDETLRRPFDRWCAQVAPFLRHLWRAKMKVRGIRPESIFTPHTIFHTRFQVDDHNTVIGLAMQPFTLMSPTHSVVVFDPQQRVLLAHDPSDYARTFVAEAGPTPSELWQELEHITTRPGAMQEDFTTYLHKSLSIWPFELLPKTVEHLSPRRNPDVNDSWETNSLLQQRSELAEQIRLAVFPSKLVTLLNQHAFHSARSLIQTTRVPLNQKACLFLWHVLVECLAISESPNIFIPSLAHSNEVATQAESAKIAQLLYQAQQFDSRLVREWVEKLAGSQDLQPAVSLLQRDWMRLEQYLTTLQLQTLYKASSSAQTAFLARELESVSRTITSDGESTATVLAKIGFSLTSLLLSDAGVVPFSDVRALLEILVGEQSQSFNSSQADV